VDELIGAWRELELELELESDSREEPPGCVVHPAARDVELASRREHARCRLSARLRVLTQ
jgi:hypothetical protein